MEGDFEAGKVYTLIADNHWFEAGTEFTPHVTNGEMVRGAVTPELVLCNVKSNKGKAIFLWPKEVEAA